MSGYMHGSERGQDSAGRGEEAPANLIGAWHHQIDTVFIDVEGACNLRCVYCSQSDRDFQPHSGMKMDVLERAIEFAKTYGRGFINVTSEGEFTHAKNWTEIAQRLLNSGLMVGCTSNMARIYTAEEIGILSRLKVICVSIDSADLRTLRAIRRSADIRTITFNLMRIAADAADNNRPPPKLIINCVLSTKNTLSIAKLCSYCYTLGVQSITVSPLHNYGIFGFDKTQLGLDRVDDPLIVWNGSQLELLKEEFIRAKATANRMNRDFILNNNVIQRLLNRLNETPMAEGPAAGETRLCLHPWELMFIRNNGGVMPCCYGADDIGNIREQGVEAVMKGEKLAALRSSLLTGVDLQPACRKCDGQPVASIGDMRSLVKDYLAAKGMRMLSIAILSIQKIGMEMMEAASEFSAEIYALNALAAMSA